MAELERELLLLHTDELFVIALRRAPLPFVVDARLNQLAAPALLQDTFGRGLFDELLLLRPFFCLRF